ncbi:diphthine methyltransferase-like isoform X1 [Leptidea sinapis]|uniref:diphthine methyltransferase-like isoform X1 n=1 Tax=Leptidea sinapis TaxID=189913 RepID=UPI0021324AAF|nr:diphthine methyltransferase-like isoform X1 [Leptidea sinapis]
MGLWKTKLKWQTEYSADSVEWCPVQGYTDVLVCGTYQLDKAEEGNKEGKQNRLGRIYLFVVKADTTELSPLHSIDTAGILDQKWCYHKLNNHPVLGVVTADGFIEVHRLVDNDGVLTLELWLKESVGEDVLALSLDWSTNKTFSDHPYLVVSDSGGNVMVLQVEDDCLRIIGKWKAHNFEAWISAFNYWNDNLFYSGGDDCVFKAYDQRVAEAVAINRTHGAGVTTIRCHTDNEHQLLSGSYDEYVRLWDLRQLKRSVSEQDVTGGVWRLKWHPQHSGTIVAACMYGGFRLLRHTDVLHVVSEYLEHESIAYGVDWNYDQSCLVATCSFYDCKLHIAEVVLDR